MTIIQQRIQNLENLKASSPEGLPALDNYELNFLKTIEDTFDDPYDMVNIVEACSRVIRLMSKELIVRFKWEEDQHSKSS